MSRKKVLLTSLIVIVLVVSACALLFLHIRNSQEPAAEPETSQEESAKAIDFTVLDYDLNEVHLFDYSGKPVILNFWASWCPNCVHEFPSFQSLYEEYGDEIQFMMIDLVDGTEETVEIAKQFLSENSFTFPVYFDITMQAATIYDANAIPLTYLINKDGEVVAYGRGALDYETLKNAINEYLIQP